MALEIEGSNPSTHPNASPSPRRTGSTIAQPVRLADTLTTARSIWLAAVALAAALTLATGCTDSAPAADATPEWSTATVEAVQISGPPSGLPAGLPVPSTAADSIEETADGGVVARWLLPDVAPGASAVDLARELRSVSGVVVLAAELAETGGIIAFEAERDGHYVVAAHPEGEGTLLELWLDPAPVRTPTAAPSVALPDGYPEAELPIFPGATVVEAERDELGDGRERLRVEIVPAREPIEVLGFYADHLEVEGWTVESSDGILEATRGGDAVRIAFDDARPSVLRLTLEWTPPA